MQPTGHSPQQQEQLRGMMNTASGGPAATPGPLTHHNPVMSQDHQAVHRAYSDAISAAFHDFVGKVSEAPADAEEGEACGQACEEFKNRVQAIRRARDLACANL